MLWECLWNTYSSLMLVRELMLWCFVVGVWRRDDKSWRKMSPSSPIKSCYQKQISWRYIRVNCCMNNECIFLCLPAFQFDYFIEPWAGLFSMYYFYSSLSSANYVLLKQNNHLLFWNTYSVLASGLFRCIPSQWSLLYEGQFKVMYGLRIH